MRLSVAHCACNIIYITPRDRRSTARRVGAAGIYRDSIGRARLYIISNKSIKSFYDAEKYRKKTRTHTHLRIGVRRKHWNYKSRRERGGGTILLN